MQVGGPHGELTRGALEGGPEEHLCACPAGRLAVCPPMQGDTGHHAAGCLH